MDFLMNRIMPILAKIGNNNYLVAIRDGITKQFRLPSSVVSFSLLQTFLLRHGLISLHLGLGCCRQSPM